MLVHLFAHADPQAHHLSQLGLQLAKVNSLLPAAHGEQLVLPRRVGRLLRACVRLASVPYSPDVVTAAFLLQRCWLREMEHLAAHGPVNTYVDKAGEVVEIRPRLFALLPIESKKAQFVTVDKAIAFRLTGTHVHFCIRVLLC